MNMDAPIALIIVSSHSAATLRGAYLGIPIHAPFTLVARDRVNLTKPREMKCTRSLFSAVSLSNSREDPHGVIEWHRDLAVASPAPFAKAPNPVLLLRLFLHLPHLLLPSTVVHRR